MAKLRFNFLLYLFLHKLCNIIELKKRDKYFYLFGRDNKNLLTTVQGWWWNPKKGQGFLNRPIAEAVSTTYNINLTLTYRSKKNVTPCLYYEHLRYTIYTAICNNLRLFADMDV